MATPRMAFERIPTFRSSSSAAELISNLGPLAELPGTWSGSGFNLIARPDFEGGNDIFLELNLTEETLVFDSIGAPVPNRGSAQNDINLFGVHYLQKINDAITHGALHIEPGIWATVPTTQVPSETPSVARMASIPHGTSMLAEGQSFTVAGGPILNPVNTVPFAILPGNLIGNTPAPGTLNPFPEYNLGVPNAFRTNPLPTGITQDMVTNPVSALSDAIVGQTIEQTIVLNIGTVPSFTVATVPPTVTTISDGGGGVGNIPFLNANATAATVLATFWIEKVTHPSGYGHYLQLQYVQTVLLNFLGLSWPHVSVATLIKH